MIAACVAAILENAGAETFVVKSCERELIAALRTALPDLNYQRALLTFTPNADDGAGSAGSASKSSVRITTHIPPEALSLLATHDVYSASELDTMFADGSARCLLRFDGDGDKADRHPVTIALSFPNTPTLHEIGSLYVAPHARRVGHASVLVHAAVADIASRDLAVRYVVDATNAPSIELATRCGLREVMRLEHWLRGEIERVNLRDERGVTSPPLTEMSLEARIKTLRRNLMSFQIFKESRREFIVGSVRASAVVAGAVLAPMAFASSLSAPPVAGIAATLGTMTAAANTDLLHALGTRIGLEIAAEIGGEGADAVPLALSYADNAGPAIDPLQAGIAHAMVLACGAEGAACIETSAPYSSVLGVALISNPATGRMARVEIFPEALSHLTMIQEATASASLQKQAVMSASSDAFYRVTYPS